MGSGGGGGGGGDGGGGDGGGTAGAAVAHATAAEGAAAVTTIREGAGMLTDAETLAAGWSLVSCKNGVGRKVVVWYH